MKKVIAIIGICAALCAAVIAAVLWNRRSNETGTVFPQTEEVRMSSFAVDVVPVLPEAAKDEKDRAVVDNTVSVASGKETAAAIESEEDESTSITDAAVTESGVENISPEQNEEMASLYESFREEAGVSGAEYELPAETYATISWDYQESSSLCEESETTSVEHSEEGTKATETTKEDEKGEQSSEDIPTEQSEPSGENASEESENDESTAASGESTEETETTLSAEEKASIEASIAQSLAKEYLEPITLPPL